MIMQQSFSASDGGLGLIAGLIFVGLIFAYYYATEGRL